MGGGLLKHRYAVEYANSSETSISGEARVRNNKKNWRYKLLVRI